MAAYIDGCRNRFKVGPICRVLSEALVRDVMDIHAGEFSAVYGYRKVWHEPIGKGWDPGEVGRDQVMNIMRGLGIQGVRRGKTPVATKPAKGTGGGPDLVDCKFEAEAPNLLHVAGIAYVRMADGRFAYTAFVTDVFARRIVLGVRHHHEHGGAAPAGVGAGDRVGLVAWRDRRSCPPQRSWRAVHRRGVRHQGDGVWHAAVDRHGRRLLRQRHGRIRQRRVQDRARLAAQALP